ncbi:MAG: poly(ribitol-phosphate) beta-N-acetylglucosaminyltransferase [Thermoleophilaceae bacterium]|nr:poly(ribitol-phosphate) beta-N-acetylglucosaminyltransferase [Thermoleophilaceae bacterium]
MSSLLKVSAVVPVFNPGSNIDECIQSLIDQSLPPDEYEVIFVDDGSTDGTPARLDALAAEHPHVRVEHIPPSGWPGKPRNVGIEMARGEFVYFVDNDDWVGHEALERMYDRAVERDADVVMGKVVGRGKYVPRALFVKNRDDVTLEWGPLVRLLAPHKLFRKSLLDEYGIRFPEGRRRLEDHVFVMHAYFHARRISILADYPCYYWVLRRDESTNASYQAFEAKGYYANVREVLDLVEAHTEPGRLRDKLLVHWYRGKMLGRVGGRWFPNRDPKVRRELYEEVGALARERYGPEFDTFLSRSLRVRSYLLREGTYEQLSALAHWEAELRADVTVQDTRWQPDGTFVMPFKGRLVAKGDKPIQFRQEGERLLWVPPEELHGDIPEDLLDMTPAMKKANVQPMIRARHDKTDFVLPHEHTMRLEPAGDGYVTPVLRGEARIEPGKAAAGSKPRAGRWEVLAATTVCGFSAAGRVRAETTAAEYEIRIDQDGAVARRSTTPLSAVKGLLARRLPGLARVIRRKKERRSAAAAH